MADASYTQESFLGGEISQWAQGQFSLPLYKKSANRLFNIWPSDEGAGPRRPGTRALGTTYLGRAGRLIPFDFTEQSPYNMEFTDNLLRFWNDTSLVNTNDSLLVTSISNASPAVFNLPKAVTWATGDIVTFNLPNPALAYTGQILLNKQFILNMTSPTQFTVMDSITGQQINATDLNPAASFTTTLDGPISSAPPSDAAISASPVTKTFLSTLSPVVNHIASIPTPYAQPNTSWQAVRFVQGYNLGVLLHGSVAPHALAVIENPTETSFAGFEFFTASFQDGPYLDAPPAAIATPSSTSGTVQLTFGYSNWVGTTIYGVNVLVTYNGVDYTSLMNNNVQNQPDIAPTHWQALSAGSMINSGQGFLTTDVGRMIRLFSQPQIWDLTHAYASGDAVTYNGEYFTSLIGSNTNNQPDISLNDWTINPSGAVWTWGVITAINAANQVTVQLQGTPLLYQSTIFTFRLGAWSNTTGWPTCGCYQEGRFWFAGAIPNRFDSSSPNQPFNMAPTGQDGTVSDANAISYTLNASENNPIFWMEPDHQGIILGTQEAEWLVTSGASGNPMTPSNIQAHRQTKYGSSNILPVRTGLTVCFVKRYARRVVEYLADIFSGRFYGPDLTQQARHLGARGIAELAYQEELVPTIWMRNDDGTFTGTTYRRTSLFSNQPPEFNAWHQHALGSQRNVESICVGPSVNGSLDALAMVTNEPSTNIRFVEQMTTLNDETAPLTKSWFLDTAVTPQAAQLIGTNIIFGGLSYLNGHKVSVFAAGIDCGDYVVTNGQVSVPLGYTDPLTGQSLTIQNFQILQPKASQFEDLSVGLVVTSPATTVYQIPCVIGFNYESQGQLCRPQISADTGARNGPGFGKKRRSARYAVQLVNSLGCRVGTNLDKTNPVPVNKIEAGGKNLPYLSMYSGIIRETLNDDFSYDSMLAWKINRPYPTTVTALGGFIETQDV